MTIDLTKTPPTETEIQKRKTEVFKNLKKYEISKDFLVIVTFMSVIVWLISIVLQNRPFTLGTISFKMLSIDFYLIFAFTVSTITVFYLKSLKKKIKAIEMEPFYLLPVSKNLTEHTLTLCKTNSICEAYRVAVVKSGRELTIAEFDAMNEWVETKKQKLIEQQL